MISVCEKLIHGSFKVPRIRVGKQQMIETLINDEALLLAKYLRDEQKRWMPRVMTDRLEETQ